MKNRNEKKIAMFDSLRSKNKGLNSCSGISCIKCLFYINNSKCTFLACGDIDKAIEIIDNYELPIKKYTLEELDRLEKGTLIEVFYDGEWLKREFISIYKNKIIVMNEYGNTGIHYHARPVQEVKDDVNDN